MEKTKAYIFSSTPQELTGQPLEELQKVGLADCELDVFASQHEEVTSYEVVVRTPPLEVDRFVGLLNFVAPSQYDQFTRGIENDWAIAQRPNDSLHKAHERLGEPWQEFVRHSAPFLEVIRSGSDYWPNTSDIDYYDTWRSRIPEPLALEPEKWTYESYNMPVADLIRQMKAGGVPEIEQILLTAAKLVIEWGKDFNFEYGPEFVRMQQKLEKVFQYNVQYKQIAAFAKLPRRYRAVVQGNALAHIFEDQKYIPEIFNGHYWCTYKLGLSYHSNKLPNFQQIIDAHGIPRIINTGLSWGFGVPIDYRAIEQATITTLEHPNKLFSAQALVVDMGRDTYGNKRKQEVFIDRRTVTRTKALEMHPLMAWQDTLTLQGEPRTQWDLRNVIQERMKNGMLTRMHHNGLLGLIISAGFSKDILGHEKLWKTERKLPKNDAVQQMGAAQLPLLALMFQRQIAHGSFVNAIRQEVRTVTAQ